MSVPGADILAPGNLPGLPYLGPKVGASGPNLPYAFSGQYSDLLVPMGHSSLV